jgi:excisionase family DNA binding protein
MVVAIEAVAVEPKFGLVEVAARSRGLGYSTLRKWIAEGKLKTFRPHGHRRHLVEFAELDAVIRAGQVTAM